jgi:hypothetical protein
MSSRHLSCQGCRIRVRANAPEIELLEGGCPICGAKLRAVPFPSGVMGFRSFDLDVLSEQESSNRPPPPAQPVDLVARRQAALERDGFDADRSSHESGGVSGGAVAEWPGGALIPARKSPVLPQLVDQGPVRRSEPGQGLRVFVGGPQSAHIELDVMGLDDRSVRQ